MTTLIFRKVLGDLAHNKVRTLLAVLSITAGVFAVGLAFGALGVLRAVGTTASGIVEVFCGEGILLGVLSWLFAVPLSYPGARVFSDAIGNVAFGTPIRFPLLGQRGYTLVGNRVSAFGASQLVAGDGSSPSQRAGSAGVRVSHVHTVQSHNHPNREEKDGTISLLGHGMD